MTTTTFEQFQAARAEMGAVNRELDSCGADVHQDEASLLTRHAAAQAVCDAWFAQPDAAVDAHNALMQAAGEAE